MGVLMLFFQNCSPSNDFFGSGTVVNPEINPVKPVDNEGNGEGYMGKLTFVKYDTNNSCGGNPQAPQIETAIEKVDDQYYLTIENCQDIADVLLDSSAVAEDPLDESKIVYNNEPLAEESVQAPGVPLILSCTGTSDYDAQYDTVVTLSVFKDATTNQHYMTFHGQALNRGDGSVAFEYQDTQREASWQTIPTEPGWEMYRVDSLTNPAEWETELKWDVNNPGYYEYYGRDPDGAGPMLPITQVNCSFAN